MNRQWDLHNSTIHRVISRIIEEIVNIQGVNKSVVSYHTHLLGNGHFL